MKLNKIIFISIVIMSLMLFSTCNMYKNIFLDGDEDLIKWEFYSHAHPKLGENDPLIFEFHREMFTEEINLEIDGEHYSKIDVVWTETTDADYRHKAVITPISEWPSSVKDRVFNFGFTTAEGISFEIDIWIEKVFDVLYVDAYSDATQPNGSKDNPYKTINGALSDYTENTLIYVAEGDYAEYIHINKDGVALLGSFPPTFEGMRDFKTHTTTIRPPDNYSYAKAILIKGTEDNHITNKTIISGFNIEGETSDGAGGVETTVAIQDYASPIILSNTIYGDNSGTSNMTTAIWNTNYSSPIIIGCFVYGGNSPDCAGIQNGDNSSPLIVNNIIFGGNYDDTNKNGTRSNGIFNFGAENVVIINNVIGGGSTTNSSNAIYITDSNVEIKNNILYAVYGETQRTGIVESASNNVIEIYNNDIWSSNGAAGTAVDFFLYKNEETEESYKKVEIDDFNNLDGVSENVSLEFELILDSETSTFVEISPNSPPEVKYGGLDLSAYFGEDSDGFDFYGRRRSAEIPDDVQISNDGDGWSMGPFEYYEPESDNDNNPAKGTIKRFSIFE